MLFAVTRRNNQWHSIFGIQVCDVTGWEKILQYGRRKSIWWRITLL